MLNSKFSLYHTLLLCSFLALAGCRLPEPSEEVRDSSATQIYVRSSKSQHVSTQLYKDIDIPESKIFSFQVCLNKTSSNTPVGEVDFLVKTDISERNVTATKEGCLNWTETFIYSHLAKAAVVEHVIQIKPTEFFSGTVTTSFAVNPWENQSYSLQSEQAENVLRGDDKQQSLKGLKYEKINSTIWLEDLRLVIEQGEISKNGINLNFEIRANPMYKLLTVNDGFKLNMITYGDWDAELGLVHVYSDGKKTIRRPLVPMQKIRSVMAGGFLMIEGPVTLPNVCRVGQVYLGLKLTPKASSVGLKPFEGIFTLGECENFKNTFFSRMKAISAEMGSRFRLDEYFNEGQATVGDGKRPELSTSDFYQKAQVEVLKLISFTSITADNHFGVDRLKKFKGEACFEISLDRKRLSNTKVLVTGINGKTEERITNHQGCLEWNDEIAFKYMDKECWLDKQIKFSSDSIGLNQSVAVYVNPWSTSHSFVIDSRFNAAKPSCQTEKSPLIPTNASLEKVKYEYPMDQFLNQTFRKFVSLSLSAEVLRKSPSSANGYNAEPIPVGDYLIRWAVTDTENPQANVFQYSEAIGTANLGGTISVDYIPIETFNNTSVGQQSFIFFQVLPLKKDRQTIDTDWDVESKMQYMPIVLSEGDEAGKLHPLNQFSFNMDDLKNSYQMASQFRMSKMEQMHSNPDEVQKLLFSQNDQGNVQLFLRRLVFPEGKDRLAEKSASRIYPSTRVLDQIINGKVDPKLLRLMCNYFFQLRLGDKISKSKGTNNQPLVSCAVGSDRDPLSVYNVLIRDYVKDVTDISEVVPVDIEVSDFNTGLAYMRSFNLQHSVSQSVDGGLSFKVPGFEFLSPSAGYKIVVSQSESQNQSNGLSVQSGLNFLKEKITRKMRANVYQKCLSVQIKDNFLNDPNIRKHINLPNVEGLISLQPVEFCFSYEKPNYQILEESYYTLTQKQNGNQITNPNGKETRKFFLHLRGEIELNRFWNFSQVSMKTLKTEKTQASDSEDWIEYMKNYFFSLNTTMIPGTITHPVVVAP